MTKGTQTRFQVIPQPTADFSTGTTCHAPVSTEPYHETGRVSPTPVYSADPVTEPVGNTPSPDGWAWNQIHYQQVIHQRYLCDNIGH